MGRVVHFEIHAKDMSAITKFYSEVFDWKTQVMGPEMGNYVIVTTGVSKPGAMWPGINGGITPRHGEPAKGDEAVNAFVCTIDVDDLDAMMTKVKKAGGTVALDKMEVPGVGWLAYMKDPENNLFGMMQPNKKAAAPPSQG